MLNRRMERMWQHFHGTVLPATDVIMLQKQLTIGRRSCLSATTKLDSLLAGFEQYDEVIVTHSFWMPMLGYRKDVASISWYCDATPHAPLFQKHMRTIQ